MYWVGCDFGCRVGWFCDERFEVSRNLSFFVETWLGLFSIKMSFLQFFDHIRMAQVETLLLIVLLLLGKRTSLWD